MVDIIGIDDIITETKAHKELTEYRSQTLTVGGQNILQTVGDSEDGVSDSYVKTRAMSRQGGEVRM